MAARAAATSTLVYILARYTVASDALARLASELCPGIPDHGLEWRGQVSSNGDEGIPDAEGRDHLGTRVVLEAKFDAVLTPVQLGTAYLERLRAHTPGLLLYVAPSDRIPAIWPKLLAGPAQATGQPADSGPPARPFLRHTRDDGRVVAITTWDVVLERIEGAARDLSDGDLLCDIRQLAGLVRWQTRTQWLPIAR